MDKNPYSPPETSSDLSSVAMPAEYRPLILRQQLYVNSLLRRGIVFSIFWLCGFGSMYSVYLAIQAHQIIRKSNGEIRGMIRDWWCYALGGIGICGLGTVLIATLVNG